MNQRLVHAASAESMPVVHDAYRCATAVADDALDVIGAIRQHNIFCQTTADGLLSDVNDAFCKVSGYSRGELIGSPVSLLQLGKQSTDFLSNLSATLATGEAWRGELSGKTRDGRLVWLDTSIMPVCASDGSVQKYISICHDTTSRRRSEEILSRMGRILEHSSNEIFVFDAQTMQFMLVNRGARDNLGFSLAELEKMTPIDLKPEMDVLSFEKLLEPLRAGKVDLINFETVHQRRNGSSYPVYINLHYARTETPPVFVAIVQDMTERQQRENRIRELAMIDQLTGLANRTLLFQRLRSAIIKARYDNCRLHLLFMDLDRFKQVNDSLGHAKGDEVLVSVANNIANVFDADQFLARIGGDEFVAIVPNATDAEVNKLAQQVTDLFKNGVQIAGQRYSIGISLGIASFPDHAATADILLRNADLAMYTAKAQGAGYRRYVPEQGEALARRQQIAERLLGAIETNALKLVYQPFNRLDTGLMEGAEALLRWDDPILGAVTPPEIIAVARANRLVSRVGSWVIERVCQQIAEWQKAGMVISHRIAINVETEQIEDGSIVSDFRQFCEKYCVDPNMLEVEITEGLMMNDLTCVNEVLHELKSMGISIAIDDFGTGYSSLRYLNKLAVDRIKIDMSFIGDLLDNPASRQIVAATIAMAKGLAIGTIAEGVENGAQAKELGVMGCSQAQGWLFSQGLPPAEFLRRWLVE